MQRKKKHKLKLLFGSTLLLTGCICFFAPVYQKEKAIQVERERLHEFFETSQTSTDSDILMDEKVEDAYIAVLHIPKISLKKGLFAIGNLKNDVDSNIMILKESDMPDINRGNFIVAAHSGVGKVAYFNGLEQLELGDYAYVYYQGMQYVYQVARMYTVEKTGQVSLRRDRNDTTLTMITCKVGTNEQIVVVAKQVDKNPYI